MAPPSKESVFLYNGKNVRSNKTAKHTSHQQRFNQLPIDKDVETSRETIMKFEMEADEAFHFTSPQVDNCDNRGKAFGNESDNENSKSMKKSKKKDQAEKMIEMVSFKYSIPDKKHPFHNLDGVVGSVDVEEILNDDFDKSNFKVNDEIEFIKVLDQALPVKAYLTFGKTFKVKEKYLKRNLMDFSDVEILKESKAVLVIEEIMNKILNTREKSKKAIFTPKPTEYTSDFDDDISQDIEERECRKSDSTPQKRKEFDNKLYTNTLKALLMDLAREKYDYDDDQLLKPPGYYSKTYPREIRRIKQQLEEFVPIGKDEKSSWVAACACIAQSQCKKRRDMGLLGKRSY